MPEEISENFRQSFSEAVSGNDEDISLGEAAMYIAGEQYPDLQVSSSLATIDALAEEADQYVGSRDEPARCLHRLSEYLYQVKGFQGNRDDYYNPDNSFLNRVLERKLGIPITLSIVYIAVGQKLGLVLEGIGLPGHFLLRHGPPEWELYVDPFEQGRLISKTGCEDIVNNLFEGSSHFRDEFLAPYTKKQILVRLLTNLRGIYINQHDYGRAIAAADRIDIIGPGIGSNLKNRAWLHTQLNQYRLAIRDLELYLNSVPEPEDSEDVKDSVAALWRRMSTLN